MNPTQRQMLLDQRRMAASLDAAAVPALHDEPVHLPGALRRGLAKIVSHEGDGLYKVTELWWAMDTLGLMQQLGAIPSPGQ